MWHHVTSLSAEAAREAVLTPQHCAIRQLSPCGDLRTRQQLESLHPSKRSMRCSWWRRRHLRLRTEINSSNSFIHLEHFTAFESIWQLLMTRHPPCTQHISHTYALWQLWQLWNMDRPDMTGSKQNEILMTWVSWVLLNPNESGGGHRESHLGPDTPREPRRQPPGDVGEALRLGPEADLALGATGTDADRCWPMLWFWPGVGPILLQVC